MIYCNDCGEIFDERDASYRKAELEDSVEAWQSIMICPCCGSEELEEAGTCERCGEPIPPEDRYCECCEGDLYGIVDKAVCEVGGEYIKAKDILMDYIERRWF